MLIKLSKIASGTLCPIILKLILTISFVAVSTQAKSDVVTYDYTGNTIYRQFDFPLFPMGSVTGSASFNIPTDYTGNAQAISYSLSALGLTVSSDPAITSHNFFGFSNGQIVSWNLYGTPLPLVLPSDVDDSNFVSTFSDGVDAYSSDAASNAILTTFPDAPGVINGIGFCQPSFSCLNSNDPGTWTRLSPSTLFSSQVKETFWNIAGAAEITAEALSAGTLTFQSIKSGIFDTVDYIALLLGNPAAKEIFAEQVLDNTAVGLATYGALDACSNAKTGIGAIFCGVAAVVLSATVLDVIAKAIQEDPPDPNYQAAFIPTIEPTSVSMSEACASANSAAEAVPVALDDVNEWLNALYVTNNRYQTALNAGDVGAANLQATTYQSYVNSYAASGEVARRELGCLSDLLDAAGLGTNLLTQSEETDLLNSLQNQDISTLTDALNPLGFTPEQVSNMADAAINDPPPLPTETVDVALSNLGDSFRQTTVSEPRTICDVGIGIAILFLFFGRAAIKQRKII